MPITQRITKRVATQGASGAIPSSLGGNTWGGSWGGTWGNVWLFGTPETPATGEEPAIDITRRISGTVTAISTKRVAANSARFGTALLLEGDEDGDLLFESGAGSLLLEGAALAANAFITRRVAS